MKKSHTFSLIILGLIIFALTYEIARDALTKNGDFIGYVLVGNLTMEGKNIYGNPLINTWPPFFSLVSVPIAIVDNINKYAARFIWLLMSLFAMIYVVKYTTRLTLNRTLTFFPIRQSEKLTKDKINVSHWIILVPILIVFRYMLDNFSNIQINIIMLWLCMSSIFYFTKGKDVLAALFLAFGISIKVYPIFLLLYFLVKREFKIASYTILFCIGFSCLPFLVFGYDQTMDYYSFWYNQNVVPFASVAHKNQSFFSMMRSLLMHESPGLNQPLNKEIYINILNLTIHQVKMVSYGILAIAGSAVIYLFRNKLTQRDSLKLFLEFAFILTITPILSPLAWKAFFIFLFPGYFIIYLFIFRFKYSLSKTVSTFIKTSFYLSIVLTVLSSELFIGKYYSDVAEAYSCITVGTILVALNILFIYFHYDKFDTESDL